MELDFEEVLLDVVFKLIDKAVKTVPIDVEKALIEAYETETSEIGVKMLEAIVENIKIAREEGGLICQDTGIPVFIVEEGLETPWRIDYHRVFTEAVSKATVRIPLRPNVVHPLTRVNTGDNTGVGIPVLHVVKTDGSDIKIHFMPKGAGSENVSSFHMLTPVKSVEAIKNVILSRVVEAGGMPCPPTILGVGLGGTAEEAMLMAKRVLLRPVGERNANPEIAKLESELFEAVNKTGIGPMGLGGRWTCLDVKIEYAYCHTASLPLAINFQCWAARRASAIVKPNGYYEVL
ncbi:MAG: fumarate hydratase [Candidatus Bathyarchaeia archaeon]